MTRPCAAVFILLLCACAGTASLPEPRSVTVYESFVEPVDHRAILAALPPLLACIRRHHPAETCGLRGEAFFALSNDGIDALIGNDNVGEIRYEGHDPQSNRIEVMMDPMAGHEGSAAVLHFRRDGAGWRAVDAAVLIADQLKSSGG